METVVAARLKWDVGALMKNRSDEESEVLREGNRN
jgi:hypothetical protein